MFITLFFEKSTKNKEFCSSKLLNIHIYVNENSLTKILNKLHKVKKIISKEETKKYIYTRSKFYIFYLYLYIQNKGKEKKKKKKEKKRKYKRHQKF